MAKGKNRFEVIVNGRSYTRCSDRNYTHAVVVLRSFEKAKSMLNEYYTAASLERDYRQGYFVNKVLSWHSGAANAQKAHRSAIGTNYYTNVTIVEVGSNNTLPGDRSPETDVADVSAYDEGSVHRFQINRLPARDWAQKHLGLEGWQWLGQSAFAVDHRFGQNVAHAFLDNGFSVEWES